MAVTIDGRLVARLIDAQFPQWARLPVVPVEPSGHDNRTFRLGDALVVRLPSAARYAAQVGKEQRWLPVLALGVPLAVPVPVARGQPTADYPWPWSVYEWLPGRPATGLGGGTPLDDLAGCLGRFLAALQRVDIAGGPPPGPHNFWRGAPLQVYAGETRAALLALRGRIDAERLGAIWDAAMAATWPGPPVWFHGDVSAANLLVDAHGRLGAVIDFGCCGVGDPACDLAIAWTLLDGSSRRIFRDVLAVDDAAWLRGQGWALWKALVVLADAAGARSSDIAVSLRVLDALAAAAAGRE